jgi:hypothetical protein
LALLAAIAGIGLPPAARAAEGGVRIVRTFFGWREAASFKRISEYFDGKENTGGEIVLRTHPDQRAGYYFLVRVDNSGAPLAARIVLRVFTPDGSAPRAFTFDTQLPGRESVFDLGLTGTDWPGRKINAVAWRLELLDATGRTLATDKSYLWDKPVGE